jgi:hypothetical protein
MSKNRMKQTHHIVASECVKHGGTRKDLSINRNNFEEEK